MAASSPVLIPVEEYLRTVYRPDCDYIDGEVLERNMGEVPHGRIQGFFARYFAHFEDEWQIDTLPETRLQVAPTNYRIPDLMVVAIPYPDTRIVRTPPVLCIEILSSADRMRAIQRRIDDYARMGVRASWVIDPWKRQVWSASSDGILHERTDCLGVTGSPIEIAVPAIWAELDRLKRRAAI
jgi:Uma2 family endonuclease